MTMYQEIPISQLVISKHNVRRVPPSESAQKTLAASIKAHGLKQNLVVRKAGKKYEVHAGGRRLAALQSLIAAGDLPEDFAAPCLVEDSEDVTATSLAENLKADLHPADEAQAYAAMINEGADVDQVAEAFGVTDKHVQKRLRIAGVAPKLLDLYREGELHLGHITAFAITEDQDKQLAAFKHLGSGSRHMGEWGIRQFLTEHSIDADSRLGKLITLDAYRERGGAVTEDLFNDDVMMDDLELVETMVNEITTAEREKLLKQGWKWVDIDTGATGDWQITDRFAAKISARTKADKANAGVVIYFNHDGKLRTVKGLVRKEDRKKAAGAGKAKGDAGTTPAPLCDEELPNGLISDLRFYRLQALQAHLLTYRRDLLEELLAFQVADMVLSDERWAGRPLTLKGEPLAMFGACAPFLDDTEAGKALGKVRSDLNTQWLAHETTTDRWKAWLELLERERKEITAYCTAVMIHQVDDHLIGTLAQQAEINLHDWWQPTADMFYSRLNKGQLFNIVTPILGKEWAAQHANDKKGQLVEAIATDEGMKHYLPPVMEFGE